MPRLILTMKNSNKMHQSLTLGKIVLFSILILGIALILSYLISIEYIQINYSAKIFDMNITSFIIFAAIVIVIFLFVIFIIKKFNLWPKIKEKIQSTSAYKRLKKGDIKGAEYEIFREKQEKLRKIKDFKNRLPITQVKKLLNKEEGQKVINSGKDLASKLKIDKNIMQGLKFLDRFKDDASKLLSGVFYNESDQKFPNPEELLTKKIQDFERRQSQQELGKVQKILINTSNMKFDGDSETESNKPQPIEISQVMHAPIEFVPQVNATIYSEGKKRIFKLISTVLTIILLISILLFVIFK